MSTKKIIKSEKNQSPLIPRHTGIRKISTKESRLHREHMGKNRIQIEYYNPTQCMFSRPFYACTHLAFWQIWDRVLHMEKAESLSFPTVSGSGGR
jgi:hypothetical protein